MVFVGSRFILFVFAGLCGLLAATILFLGAYNLVLDEKTATKGAVFGTLAFAFLVGLLFSWVAYKFAKNWAIAIIAAWGGIAICVPLSKVAGLHGTAFSLGAAIIGAILGFYVGRKFNMYVRSIGTAVIGSFLATRGLGSFLGGYPNETDIINNTASGKFEYNPAILGYAACMVALAVIGSIVQIRMNRGRTHDDDEMFAQEDEAQRKCC